MTTKPKKPDTLASLAKSIAKEAQAAAPGLAAAYDAALAEKNAAQEAFSAAEAALDTVRRAKAAHERRAAAAPALARLAAHPDLIDALLSQAPATDHCPALAKRGLMHHNRNTWRGSSYLLTELGRDVAALARELRDRLPATE